MWEISHIIIYPTVFYAAQPAQQNTYYPNDSKLSVEIEIL